MNPQGYLQDDRPERSPGLVTLRGGTGADGLLDVDPPVVSIRAGNQIEMNGENHL